MMRLGKPHFRQVRSALVLLSTILVLGCSDASEDPALSLQGSWMLSQVAPAAYNNFAAPDLSMCADLVFTKEEEPAESNRLWGYKVSGELPVNSYQGNYQASQEALYNQAGQIDFVNLGNTEVAAVPPIKQFEAYYLQTLQDVDKFEVKNDVLTLWVSGKNQKLVFVRGASSCGKNN
ncbi:META domain-containing protein [Rufibacter aurantiacus]|uniref:META domain-containing protein n=1 Tax=Rufibacter aurantiacus TaxID=2817374 RepID=UPI001B31185C|nr:META domain-containing protein [Rufibacter aurantiacus]